MKLEGEGYETAPNGFMRRHHQAAIDIIARARLRRPEVKALTNPMRAEYVKELAGMS